jgi:hypothetical protein
MFSPRVELTLSRFTAYTEPVTVSESISQCTRDLKASAPRLPSEVSSLAPLSFADLAEFPQSQPFPSFLVTSCPTSPPTTRLDRTAFASKASFTSRRSALGAASGTRSGLVLVALLRLVLFAIDLLPLTLV